MWEKIQQSPMAQKAWRSYAMSDNPIPGFRKKGDLVGTDQFGNLYYESKSGLLGQDRWVVFQSLLDFDASQVPPEWHSWLHHISDAPGPDMKQFVPKYREEHKRNLTGTDLAYTPPGYVKNKAFGLKSTSDIREWDAVHRDSPTDMKH